MFSAILVLVALFLLLRGSLRVGERQIAADRVRLAAGVLLLPMLVQFCVTSIFLLNSDVVTSEGELDQAGFTQYLSAYADEIQAIDLIAALVAVGTAAYLILNAPGTALPSSGASNTDPTPIRRHPLNMQPGVANPNTLRPIPNVMTVADAAAYLRVTEADVIALIDAGRLPAARIGNTYRIARTAVDDFVLNE